MSKENENGNVTINQLFLVDENDNILSGVLLTKKFGKQLYAQSMGFQRKSFNTINKIINSL